MQLLDQSETSQTNHGSKIEQPLFSVAIRYLCFKLLMGFGGVVVMGHMVKSIFSVRQIKMQQHGWLSIAKTATYSHQENKP